MRWRVYYDDGSTFDGSDSPWEAPANGVQALAFETKSEAHPFRVIHTKDAYYWRDGAWYGCDIMGLWDYLMLYRGPKAVLFGRTMYRDVDFFALLERAKREGVGE